MSCLINDNQKLTLLLEPTNQYEFNFLHTVNYNSILYCGGLGTMKKEWTYVDTTVDSNDYKSTEAGKWQPQIPWILMHLPYGRT